MKKLYFITLLTLITVSSCKKAENIDVNNDMDTIATQDTTTIAKEKMIIDSTMVDSSTTDSSDVELLDKMSTKTTTKNIDETKGKYALAETKWKLVELNGKAITNTSNKEYYINLDSKTGKFAAFAGCNKIFGSFVMKAATKLAFSNIESTKMACPEMTTETNFNKALTKVDNYMIEGAMLHFHNGKRAVAKFEATK